MNRTGRAATTRSGRVTTSGQRSQAQPASCDLRARYEYYVSLARAREAAGDAVEAERLYQQADHYRRLLNTAAA